MTLARAMSMNQLSRPSLSAIGLLAAFALPSCARPAPAPEAPPVAAKAAAPKENAEPVPALAAVPSETAPKPAAPRKVGDLWVHRFSGSYRDGDMVVEEEVVDRQGDLLVVDFRFVEADEEHRLRVKMSARSERIISVTRLLGEREIPSKLSVYERLMSRTSFSPDHNAGQIAESQQTCLIGPEEFDCEMAKYRVLVGDQEATLSVARNREMKRDLAGEITAVDGTILYKAELIEMRQGPETAADEAVAATTR